MHSASCQDRPRVDTQFALSIGFGQRSPDLIGRLDGRQVVFPGFFSPFAEDFLFGLGCFREDTGFPFSVEFQVQDFIERLFGGKTCWSVVFPGNTLHHLLCLLDVEVDPPGNHIGISLVPVLVGLLAVVHCLVVVVCLLVLGLALHGELAFGELVVGGGINFSLVPSFFRCLLRCRIVSGPGGRRFTFPRFWMSPLVFFGFFPTSPLFVGEVSVLVVDEFALRVVHGCKCLCSGCELLLGWLLSLIFSLTTWINIQIYFGYKIHFN